MTEPTAEQLADGLESIAATYASNDDPDVGRLKQAAAMLREHGHCRADLRAFRGMWSQLDADAQADAVGKWEALGDE